MKKCFTLAEVLIALAVIGIVAAITLPGLATKLKKKVEDYQKTVMEAKLVQGLNLLSSQENGLNVSYDSTEEFVRALSKYLKMSTICSKENLKNCFAYDKINYDKNGQTKQQEIDKLTNAKNLSLKNENGNEYLDLAGFVLADGTPFIVTWNNACGGLSDDNGRMLVDPDRALKSIPKQCLDGLYDRNGTRGPNKFGSDVQPLFAAKIGSTCLFEVNGKCLAGSPAFEPSPLFPSEYCSNGVVKPEYQSMGIISCCTNPYCATYGDYWAGAVKMCAEQGMHLATEQELADLASYLYDKSISSAIGGVEYGDVVPSNIPDFMLPIDNWHPYSVWSSLPEIDTNYAYTRHFTSEFTKFDSADCRGVSYAKAICYPD